MSKKSELAISELNLLYECTSKENVFHKNKIKKIIDILSDEQTESDQSANEKEAEVLVFENLEEIKQVSEEKLKKELIGHSTRHKANTPMQTSDAYEIPLTWSSIIQGFKNTKDFSSDDLGADVLSKLESHLERIYNVPTYKA